MTLSPQIPQSDALREVRIDSIADLFSKDPESFTKEDEVRLVATFRQQRERWAAAEAAGGKAPGTKSKIAPQVQVAPTTSAEDIGL